MEADTLPSLLEALKEVPDPRKARGRRHPLPAVLALGVCAMLSGAHAIAQWGRDQGSGVARQSGFTRDQTPCVATLHHLFKELDRDAWERVLGQWMQRRAGLPGEPVAIDGKHLRGIHGEEVPGVHLVAAYGHHSGVVTGQQAVPAKRNEVDAVPTLLAQPPLPGRVVTGDAQFAQRETSETVVRKGGTTSGS